MKVLNPSARICEYAECRKPLMKRYREGARKFQSRKFCRSECYKAAQRVASEDTSFRRCENCHKLFAKPRKMSGQEWQNKRWCSTECRFAKYPKPSDTKTCEHCGNNYERGRRAASEFTAQRFCSVHCRNAARVPRSLTTDLSGPFVEYDINNPPPCFMSLDFFEHETRLKQSIQFNKAGPAREAKISAQMDEIRDRWCLNCPILSECGLWAKEEGYSGVAGGHWYVEGEAQ